MNSTGQLTVSTQYPQCLSICFAIFEQDNALAPRADEFGFKET